MDGYPRDSTQAAMFIQMIGPPTTCIYLECSPAVMNERLRKRSNFDDSQEAIYRKIDGFESSTMGLVRKWNGIKINASRPIEEVFEDAKEALTNEGAFTEVPLNVEIQ